MQLEKN